MQRYRNNSYNFLSELSPSPFVNNDIHNNDTALPYWVAYPEMPSVYNPLSSSHSIPIGKTRKPTFHNQGIPSQNNISSNHKDPFNYPVPFPYHFSNHYNCAQSFIRRRNERERERVRYVNEGYDTLRRCLPLPNREKRISKVEILRSAIRYINTLEKILSGQDHDVDESFMNHMGEEAMVDQSKIISDQ